MNFYKHYIGDFQRDTRHLSPTERGVYRDLLDHQYATEKPIPADHHALCRIVGCQTKAERDAVALVSREFFQAVEGGLAQKRALQEIAKAAKQRAVNQELGKRGGRPRKGGDSDSGAEPDENRNGPKNGTDSVDENATEGNPSGTDSVSQSVSEMEPKREPNRNPIQTPDTREEEDPPKNPQWGSQSSSPRSSAAADDFRPSRAGVLAVLMRQAGVQVQSGHPTLLAWANELGVTDDEAREAIAAARIQKPEPALIPAAYLDRIIRNARAQARTPAAMNAQQRLEAGNAAVLERWLGNSAAAAAGGA